MTTCPRCNTEIKDDFGLVTCAQCGAQMFIETDGKPAVVEEDLAPSDAFVVEPYSSDLPEEAAPPPLDYANVAIAQDIATSQSENFSVESEDISILPDSIDFPPPAVYEPTSPAAIMKDVAQFGNSEVSTGRDGALRFNLFIAGIDSIDIRDSVKHILDDERFLWDSEKILTSIDNGVLTIRNVSAVKSAVLVQRLRAVPVEIKWEQYAIHQI